MLIVQCALLLAGLGVAVGGCSTLAWSSGNKSSDEANINQAIYQLQAALGLADGTITQSSQAPLLADSDVSLKWVGGRADVDLTTGRIRAILVDISEKDIPTTTTSAPPSTSSTTTTAAPTTTTTKKSSKRTTTTTKTAAPATTTTTTAKAPSRPPGLSDTELDKEADRMIGLLGWDVAALETHGFKETGAQVIDYPEVGTIYQKTWAGHDPEGIANEGILQVGLDVRDGGLQSFLFVPGPETALDMTNTISKDKAIKTAADAAAKSAILNISTTTTGTPTTAANPSSTTTTAKATTTTTAPIGVDSATMAHIQSAEITGGKDMLVWVVKLAGDEKQGRIAATVYVDAVENKALLVIAG